ncbi:hypothetical protein ABZT51_22665 [Streptomyces sp. NPDC005373]|uniref:hypothetical protein n=1 Tax=Streptomyces sp. NPDC005373 TaxID=3156879 RepID=UPI0033AD58F3
MITSVLIRFAYLAFTHAFAALRLLPMNACDKDLKILALRHQITVLQRQLGPAKTAFRSSSTLAPCSAGTATSSSNITRRPPAPNGPDDHTPSTRSCAVRKLIAAARSGSGAPRQLVGTLSG